MPTSKTTTKPTKNPTPQVSIIIPIYNTAPYLEQCLTSVTHQTYQNLEILLIDDGSTDASGKIADQFAKKDHRVKVIHQKNRGQSAARNVGLRQATGDYISFIDSDDQITPNFIEKLLTPYSEDPSIVLTACGIKRQFLNTHQTELLYLSPLLPQKSAESDQIYILKLLARDGRLYSSVNKLYKTAITKNLRFDESLNFAEDTKFVLDYLKSAQALTIAKTSRTVKTTEPTQVNHRRSLNLAYLPEPLYIYNFGSKSSTINTSSLNWQNWQKSYENLKKWLGDHPNCREHFWLHLIYLRWRISHFRSKFRARKSATTSH